MNQTPFDTKSKKSLSTLQANFNMVMGGRILRIAPTSIRKRLCGNGHAGKEEVVRVIVSKFPEFKVYVTQDRKWKELYHRNMFDAIALGLVVSAQTR